MNSVVRLKNREEIKHLAEIGADVFLLDTNDLTTQTLYPLTKELMTEIIKDIKKCEKKAYIYVNKMIHETDIPKLHAWFDLLKNLDIDGIVANDFTVYVIAKAHAMDNLIIYQPGTMNTNHFDALYLENRVKGMTLSKEITLEEIKMIVESSHQIEYSLVAHGYIDMFYSKRKLISNYLKHKSLDDSAVKNNHHYRIEEQTREGTFYPILEDAFGTHIYRDKKLVSFKEVKEIYSKLSDIFLERLFMDDREYMEAIKAYDNPSLIDDFMDRYGHTYHEGFYYTPTEKTKGEKHEN
jgi:putative protease